MNINELYLKTAFCCMACDGDIAQEEVELVKNFATNSDFFHNLDVEKYINGYINEINEKGIVFLNNYLKDVSDFSLSEEQEMNIVRIAIQIIEADSVIEYSEVSFFKKIRKLLKISDAKVLKDLPDKEDYLLPDIEERKYKFSDNVLFNPIEISK
jgi:uncharacterized tellurite resistance protein B-like protein